MTVVELTPRTRTGLHAAAVECHIANLPLDHWQSPVVVVLQENDVSRTVGVVTLIMLGPIRLLAVFHHLETLTIWTLHMHKSHRPSSSETVNVYAHHSIMQ